MSSHVTSWEKREAFRHGETFRPMLACRANLSPTSLGIPCMLGRVFMGRYEVQRLLGEGGMGRVYLARQLDLGRQVVVKVMHDHIAVDDIFRDRFNREMQLMAH